jgi:hypothetical protein
MTSPSYFAISINSGVICAGKSGGTIHVSANTIVIIAKTL